MMVVVTVSASETSVYFCETSLRNIAKAVIFILAAARA
jgi:hypothetical protein